MNHILIVDDDPTIRDVVSDILEMSEYCVETACDGADALCKIRADRPVAVLLDLMMPVMDGWEFLRQLKNGEPGTAPVPVVIMSAARDASAAAGAMGAEDFLSKPFEIETILKIVGRVATNASHST